MLDERHTPDRPPEQAHAAAAQTDRRALLAGVGGLAAGAFLAGAARTAHAGPLDPPPGPIAPTPGPEPRIAINATNTPGDANRLYTITQPGSYYLTGNILGQSGKSGIGITADNVTIDLNGFALLGGGVGQTGIAEVGDNANIRVRNGHITGWLSGGLRLGSPGASVEHVSVTLCSTGIEVGDAAQIRACAASECGFDGFEAGESATFTDCSASFNGRNGFAASAGAVFARCAARWNEQSGMVGGANSIFSLCRAEHNGFRGILGLAACAVVDCVVVSNRLGGINVFWSSLVARCIADQNSGDAGIRADLGSSIVDCVSTTNSSHGIEAVADCLVRNNLCRLNGPLSSFAGILVTGADARIEGNHCTENVRGIRVTASGCLIRGNTCANNSSVNWDIATGNAVATIVAANINFAPISGDTYAGNLGTTDPNANFTY
jgi:parallel beta-helix repeat protein